MKRLNNYQKMIKYLVKDIYRKDFKEDIEQELSLYLLNLQIGRASCRERV